MARNVDDGDDGSTTLCTYLSNTARFSFSIARISCFRRFRFSVSASTWLRLPMACGECGDMLTAIRGTLVSVVKRATDADSTQEHDRTRSLASSMRLAWLASSSTRECTVPLNSFIPVVHKVRHTFGKQT